MATMGPAGAVAVLNSDFGTGIRMAAPLAMLSSLALCADKGILVKDGRALELMNEVDTVLFDKTGTLTRERPEVGRVIASRRLRRPSGSSASPPPPSGSSTTRSPWRSSTRPDELGLTPAADRRHPVQGRLRHHRPRRGPHDPRRQQAVHGDGGDRDAARGPRGARRGAPRRLHDGHGRRRRPARRGDRAAGRRSGPRSARSSQGLRERGIKHIAIISGDHEAPTRKLAESLGMDRYFAQVLPADKADYVEKLQKEGRKVCFVGDGINDSIALKKANVSISLRGASSIATDTAHIVFLEEGLAKLCELRDIARDLDRNVKRSWSMILAPNIACIAGVFTMGFGIMASVVTNNVAALAALGNGMLPLRKVAQIEAERRHRLEIDPDRRAPRMALDETTDDHGSPDAALDTVGERIWHRRTAAVHDRARTGISRTAHASDAGGPRHAMSTSRRRDLTILGPPHDGRRVPCRMKRRPGRSRSQADASAEVASTCGRGTSPRRRPGT